MFNPKRLPVLEITLRAWPKAVRDARDWTSAFAVDSIDLSNVERFPGYVPRVSQHAVVLSSTRLRRTATR